MSKETKPKSEGCRWKVLWTLLLGFLLFGASNASAYQITLIFDLPQAAIDATQVVDENFTPVGQITDGKLVIEYPGSGNPAYFVEVPSGYSYQWTVSEGLTSANCNVSSPAPGYIGVNPTPAADGGSVTFYDPNYPTPEPGGDNSITLTFVGETNAYQYVWIQNTTEYTADDGKWYEPTATSEVWNYEINKEGVASLMIASKPGYSIEVKCNTEGLINQMETGDYYLSDMSEGAGAFSLTEIDNPDSEFGGGWVLEIYNDKVSGASFTVTVKQVSQAINFSIVAGEGVEAAYASEPLGGSYVSIINGVRNSAAPINGNKFTVQWEEGQTTQLILATNPNLEEAYEIVVTADVDPGSGTYTVSYGRNMLGNAQATINLFAGAVNHNFTVTVRKIAVVEPDKEENVTLDQGFTPEVGTKYMITPPEDGTLTINAVELSRAISDLSGALYSANGTVVSPSDYSAGASVNVMGIVSNFDYVKYNVRANNTYYFQLNTVGNNVELTATMKDDTGSEEPGPGEGDSDAVYIAFASSSTNLVSSALNPATDAQFAAQADGSFVYTYPLTEADSSIFSFLIYTAEGGKYTSIGVRDGTNSWGKAGVSIDLPAQGESIEETFTDLGQFTVGSTYADDQASFTFKNNATTPFENGTVTLTLSADLSTLEVNVEAPADEPEPEDGYVALQLDNAYAVNGAGSLKLVYTPEADGVLTATQTGSSDNHLFSQEPAVIDEATGQVSETYIIYSQDVNGNTLKYNVKANTTYYVYAALNGYDDITNVTFSFEASSSDDEYAIQIGETYTVNKNTPNYYYTATEDGTLLVQTNRADPEIAAVYGQWFIYADANHLATPAGATVENANGGWLVKVPMTTGQTVYLWAETSTDIQVTFNWQEAASASTVTAVEPSTAANYDYNTYPEVKIMGEGGVTGYGEVTFSYNDVVQTLEPEYVTTNGWPEFLQIKVATLGLTNLVETAALAGAESFTITVKDLKVNNIPVGINGTGEENVTVENGTVTVTYPISKAAVYLGGESTWPETFYSSWPAGDESGIATLVFDDEIASVGSVRVSMYPLVAGGDTGEATFNSYSITPAIDGKTVTLDFTGREYAGSSSVVTVVVENAMGKNGMPVNFGEGVALYKQISFVNEPAPSDEPVEVESLDPAYGTAIDLADDGTFTFTVNFTGEAQINKILDGYGRQTGATVNPASGFAESFQITLPKSYLDQQLSGYVPGESEIIPAINLNIEATDKAGEEIAYNDPNNVRVYYPFNFDIIYGVDFNVSVVAEAEGSLDSFTVSPADGFESINAYEYTGDDAESFFDITITGPNDFFAHATEFADGVVTFNPAIEASGEYTINFPYHAFDVTASAGSGAEGDEGTAPDQDQVFNSMEKTYTFNVTITGTDEPSGNTLLLENNNFFPKPNEKYTYTPTEDGVLTVKPMENGDFTTTTVLGGLYTSDGTFVQAAETDGTDLDWSPGYSDMSYAAFNLTAGQTYYWQWSKNADGDEYALYATFEAGAEEPEPEPVDFSDYTVTPDPQVEIADATFYGTTIEWKYPVEIVKTDNFMTDWGSETAYIALSDPATGNYLTVENGEITVEADGNKLIINAVNPIVNNSPEYTAYVSAVIFPGAIKVNGQLFDPEDGYEIMIGWQLAPNANAVLMGDPVITPQKNSNVTDGFNNITVSWFADDKLYIDTDCFETIRNNAKVYYGEEAWGPYYVGNSQEWQILDIISVTGINPKGTGTAYYETAQINFDINSVTPVKDPCVTVFIPSGTIVLDDGMQSPVYYEDIAAWYHIKSVALSPINYQHVQADAFEGLRATGNDVTILNAANVTLHSSWDKPTFGAGSNEIATGYAASTTAGNVLVSFPEAGKLNDGNYTINIASGALSGVSAQTIQFVVEGNPLTIDQINVTAVPANNSALDQIDNVKISWGDNLVISTDPNFDPTPIEGEETDTWAPAKVKAQMTVNGTPQDIEFTLDRQVVSDNSDDGGGIDGAYEYFLTYTPAAPLTTAGNYSFIIPANSLYVYITNTNKVQNTQVKIDYSITPGEIKLPDPEVNVNVNFSAGGDWFDAFDVVWWKSTNVPYILQIVDESGITITKNYVEDLDCSAHLTEYQEGENTQNYDDARLVVTLAMLETDFNSTYTLNVAKGALNVIVDGVAYPCAEISYSVVPADLGESPSVELPEPTITPAEGEVDELETITISWAGFEIFRNTLSGSISGEPAKQVTMTINGGEPVNVEVNFTGQGVYYATAVVLDINATVGGEYVITVPEGTFSLTNEEIGTFNNEEIILTYTVNISDEDPETPAVLYVLGEYNIQVSNITPNPATDMQIPLNEKTGLYEGMIENWEAPTGTSVLNNKEHGKIFYTLVDGKYTFYGAALASGYQRMNFTEEGETLDYNIAKSDVTSALRPWTLPRPAPQPYYDVYVAININDMTGAFTWGYPEPEPEINALVFEDFEMELGKNPTTVEVPVSIQADEEFSYQGIEFTVTLPEGLTIEEGGIVLNDPLKGTVYGNTSDDKYGSPNTTGVVVLLDEPTAAVEDILTIKVTGKYGDIEEGTYPVTIQKVGFSDGLGSDIETPEFEAFTGYVTITEAPVPAESITIDSVTLNEPSFTDEEIEMVEEVVAGESVDMTFTVLPEDTTDEATVTADNGATASKNEDGSWTIDTSGVVVPEGEESVTVTITITAGDVEETYELTVKGVLLGDSNDNGKVTVADVVTTANYIAEKPINNFCWPNANVITNDEDAPGNLNGITVQDVTATVNIVLEEWDGNRNPQNVRRQANRYASNDRLVASNFKAGQNVIAVDLENNAQYSAIQTTIELPAGMKVDHVAVGQRAANHDLVYNVTGNELHVVLFSYENASFRGGEGSLFNIAVVADENCDDLQMKNILASDAASNGYELSFEGGLYGEATGIEGIDADAEGVRYFTVDGIEVFNPEAGQILIRVANGSAEKVIIK